MGVKDSFIYEECMKELDAIYGEKQREKIFDHLWNLEEQQTILGLLKGRKMKKKLKEKKEKNV